MTTQYLILVLALGGAGLAVAAFVWAVRGGQLDDLDTPPRRMLLDEAHRRGHEPRLSDGATDDAAARR